MYKENAEVEAFYGFNDIAKVNLETKCVKEWGDFKYYFDCSKCVNQSINDDNKTVYSCNNCWLLEGKYPTKKYKIKVYCWHYQRSK